MNIFSFMATFILMSYFLGLLIMDSSRPDMDINAAVDSELKIDSSAIGFKNFTRLNYLYNIALVLEKYKRKNFTYPLSQDEGKSWTLKVSADGKTSENWIPEINLVEESVITSNNIVEQYAYISDGINYKLIAVNPDDCASLKTTHPELISYYNELCSYGLWTHHPN